MNLILEIDLREIADQKKFITKEVEELVVKKGFKLSIITDNVDWKNRDYIFLKNYVIACFNDIDKKCSYNDYKERLKKFIDLLKV